MRSRRAQVSSCVTCNAYPSQHKGIRRSVTPSGARCYPARVVHIRGVDESKRAQSPPSSDARYVPSTKCAEVLCLYLYVMRTREILFADESPAESPSASVRHGKCFKACDGLWSPRPRLPENHILRCTLQTTSNPVGRAYPISATAVRKDWGQCLALFAMAIGGQAAALWLTDAPHYAVYQHYGRLSQIVTWANMPALAMILTQAAVCVALAIPAREALRTGLLRSMPRWRVGLALAVLAFSAAVPTESIRRFAEEVAVSATIMVLSGITLVLAVRAIPDAGIAVIARHASPLMCISGEPRSATRWETRLPRMVALSVFLVASLLSYFVWEAVPHIDDSIAYLFQAKYMSLGRLWLPTPSDPESFGVAHLLVDGDRWYGKFFPGWPALLALGVLVGMPWVVNPALGAASILLIHRFLKRRYGVRSANIGALLMAVSPWFLFMSASFMAHPASLFWLLLSMVVVDELRDGASWWRSMAAGASLGMLFLTRPFDAALVGPVVGLSALGLGGPRLRVKSVVAIGVCAALVASLYFLYNRALTGDLFVAPHRLWSDRVLGVGVDRFGFGSDIGTVLWANLDPLPGHGLADVILHANKNLFTLNFELFGWACGSLVLALMGIHRNALRGKDAPIVWLTIAVVVGHAFYWAPGGPDLGARYWYLLLLPCVVLTVNGARAARRLLMVSDERVMAFVFLASMSAMLTVMPWRIATKHFRYRDIGGEIRMLAAQSGVGNDLVFVRANRRSDYQQAFNLNPRGLDQPGTIYVWDLGPEHGARVLRQFPDRQVWVVSRAEAPGAKILMQAGPLKPGTYPPGDAPPTAASQQALLDRGGITTPRRR
jgi:hypothetical protein